MKIHLISGFLGSGKTTAIQQATRLLKEQGTRAGVITNDQGSKLVDGALFTSLSVPNREVINGCFCCNYHDLEKGIESLINADNAELVFAESVGSCTDIVATVLKPLLQFRPKASVTLSVFADARLLQMILDGSGSFDETVRYIYTKQLEEAGIIIVSKIDLIRQEELLAIEKQMQVRYPCKKLIFQNSFLDKNILNWLTALNTFVPAQKLSSLNIDYDYYAAGEAKMAWLDQSIEIFDTTGMAIQVAQTIINRIFAKVKDQQLAIGHLKFMVDNAVKISFTSCDEATIVLPERSTNHISVLINMRVETTPPVLQQIVDNAIEQAKTESACGIIVSSQFAFQPGYPRPVFRI